MRLIKRNSSIWNKLYKCCQQKIFIFYLLMVGFNLCVSCAASQTTLPERISASNQFRMFWNELQKEQKNKSGKIFHPSKEFVDKFNLENYSGEYYISGFLHVNDSFEPERVTDLNGTLSRYSNSLFTFRLPISQTSKFVRIKGIVRIELSQKVHKKNIDINH